jgi:hypothetical protein
VSSDAGKPGRATVWTAVAAGLAMGFAAATLATLGWDALSRRGREPPQAPREVASRVDLFRLPSGGTREMFLVPAGPDANGEPALARSLFPGEDPPRSLATLLVANVAPEEPWTIDLDATPLACRRSEDGAWEPLRGLDAADGRELSAAERLRLRSLGATGGRLVVEARSLRQVLLVLPPRCTMSDLVGVQWGRTPLVRDALELERIRRFREDPAAVTTGR